MLFTACPEDFNLTKLDGVTMIHSFTDYLIHDRFDCYCLILKSTCKDKPTYVIIYSFSCEFLMTDSSHSDNRDCAPLLTL